MTLCLILFELFARLFDYRMELPFYAVIAAIISMDKTIFQSFKAGRDRLTGTFFGAVIGCLTAYSCVWAPHSPWSIPVACGIGIVFLFFLLESLRLRNSVIIGGIVFLAIMVGFGSESPVKYAFIRMVDTMVGIIVAWGVNILIFPYNNRIKAEAIYREASAAFGSAEEALRHNGRIPIEKLLEYQMAYNKECELYFSQFTWEKKKKVFPLLRNRVQLERRLRMLLSEQYHSGRS